MTSEEMRPNLLTVVPGNINIENFVPGRVYKETLMLYNTYNIPIVLNLKSSDKNKLTLSETKMRIGVNQSKRLELLIQDKLNYKYTKTPIKQKKLFIHMKGELIDEKYEINLIYYHKNSANNGKAYNHNLNNNIRIDLLNKYAINNPYSEITNGYLTVNPNNNREYNNDDNINGYEINVNKNGVPLQKQNCYNINNHNSYMPIERNDNEEIITLKNIINNLLKKINELTSILEHYKENKLYKNSQLGISNNSLYFFGNNYEKEIKIKYNINYNIDNKRIISRNKILELENSTLLYRIKCLENKLSLYENNRDSKNINYNPIIIDADKNELNQKNAYQNINSKENNIKRQYFYNDDYTKKNMNN